MTSNSASSLSSSNQNETIGYWEWTWSPSPPPVGASIGIAFSGWTDPEKALTTSERVVGDLVGDKYLALGGGNSDGAYPVEAFPTISTAIADGKFSSYQGLAFDIEMGASGMAQNFSDLFRRAHECQLKVLVTVSHSAPFGVPDSKNLMTSFFSDEHIDFISPQLYTTGKEANNEFTESHDVSWTAYSKAHAAVVPSIVKADMYENAKAVFSKYGVSTQGYIQWAHAT